MGSSFLILTGFSLRSFESLRLCVEYTHSYGDRGYFLVIADLGVGGR